LTDTILAEGVPVYRGASTDVVARFVGAATQFGFDTVARVTADCPLIDAELADWCIKRTAEFDSFDLTTTKGCFPTGLDVEIYRADQMAALDNSGKMTSAEREHLTLHFYNHSYEFAVRKIAPPDNWTATDRHFTVDTQNDYDDAKCLVEKLGTDDFSILTMLQTIQ
jgi:spore coat polysaccharide biosynthesis protein SpsF